MLHRFPKALHWSLLAMLFAGLALFGREALAAGPPQPAAAPAAPAAPRPAAAPAAPAAQGVVQHIRVVGNRRISTETIRSYLLIHEGEAWSDEKVDDSLKALFATGLFADVRLSRVGNTLNVKVVENPIINRIAFEGNHEIEDKDLRSAISSRPRVVYTRSRVESDVNRILELYRRHGYFGATVNPKVILRSENRVDLVFEIREGKFTAVESINFIGNHHFSADRLRGVIATKEYRWYRILSTNDTYDPDRLAYDQQLLRKFYLAHGYADFRVASAVAELTPNRTGFVIAFTLHEGHRYRFGKIHAKIKLKNLPRKKILPLLKVHSGEWYNSQKIQNSITALTNALGNLGYAFVDIEPHIVLHRKSRKVDVTFNVKEGPRVYVQRIDIVGNVRTLDKVIRRQMLLVEGDAFNAEKLKRSKERIQRLRFFKKVQITHRRGSASDKTVITVSVEEESTGSLSLGAGLSSTDGPLADISLHEKNFLGRGEDVRVATVVSFRSQQIELNFTQPYFLNRPLAAGFNLFEIKTSPTASFFSGVIPPFQQFSYGGALRAGYQITRHLRQTLNYTLRSDDILDVQSTASLFIALQSGTHLTSSLGQVLLYDRRNDRLNPTDGYYAALGTDFAGTGFGVKFIRNKINFGYYYPLWPHWVVSLEGEAGDIFGWGGDPVYIQDRFYVGGDDFPGFQTAGLGPRDSVTQDALGGNEYYIGHVSLHVPLGLPRELGLSGRVFSYFGSLFGIDQKQITLTPEQLLNTGGKQPQVIDLSAMRVTAGVGLAWKSPLGPVLVDFAVPIKREGIDKTQFFRISFGTRF